MPDSTRRVFLHSAAAGLAVTSTCSDAFSAEQSHSEIIDTHTHFYDTERSGGVPWPNPNSKLLYKPHLPEHFREVTKKQGVSGTVIVEASRLVEDNQWILDLAKEDPFIVGVVGNLSVNDENFPQYVKRFAKNPLFRGIRISPKVIQTFGSHPLLEKHLKVLADHDLSLDVNAAAEVLPAIIQITKKMPALRIVLAHFPFYAFTPGTLQAKRYINDPKLKQYQAAYQELQNYPQVYAKVSNVLLSDAKGKTITDPDYYESVLAGIWKLMGAKRVIFGSNWPVSNRMAPYSDVFNVVNTYASKLPNKDKQAYFAGNAKLAYKWLSRN